MTVHVLALVGSLRRGSHNRQLAEATAAHAPDGVRIEIFDGLGALPFYNEDIDADGAPPAEAARLRKATAAADAVLLFSPEYNGTMPAVLKNAIDWLSRPFGAGALGGKPTAVVGTAFGRYGGVWAQEEARKAAGIAGARIVDTVSLAIPGSVTRFAELHPQNDTEVAEGLRKTLEALTTGAAAA
ncbi:NAD(P)H-dependent oxidoreductase [Saccharomonospora piscinae]|uniref:NADPH-dependent FMN reductase n=1 Tax=Saccharomonospora piscinae TaxID=687388 RepID=UPI0011071272|nr:NADPH-dependent FMN reductase [Saccharomonospora piscinae]TLW94486.1 NAD(P)H-dependent oxidoreductase [Saccharomonospora piscinae]